MRRRYWRFSRPAGSLACLLLLLVMAWFVRLAYGTPHSSPEAELRRTERRMLLPPGELVEVYEARFNGANAVTWQDGDLSVYYLYPEDDSTKQEWKHRYQNGTLLCRTAGDSSWGCRTSVFLETNFDPGVTTRHWFCVLVKNEDPRVTRGTLTIRSALGEYSRKWAAKAERTNPYYLSFRLERSGGINAMQTIFNDLCNGFSSEGTEAEAEAVFYDTEGNEVSRLVFDMIRAVPDREGSEENGA